MNARPDGGSMAGRRFRRSTVLAVGVFVSTLAGGAGAGARAAADGAGAGTDGAAEHAAAAPTTGTPHREDHGALIVLDLYGTYEEMGRQEVELLGADARDVHELYAERWGGLVRAEGMLGTFVDDVVFPVWW